MRKKLLIAFFFLLLIIGVLFFFAARYADRIVDPYVRSLLEQNKPMKHRIDYRKIRVNLINRVINIKDVRMYPDTSLVRDENIWMEVSVGVVKLTHFRIRELLFHKSLQIGDLILIQPEVELHLPASVNQDVVEEVARDTVSSTKSQLITNISLNRMLLSGGSFRLIRNDVLLAKSDDISFLIQDINLVKNSKNEPLGYTYGEVKVNLSNINIHSETGLYNISLGKFSLSKQDSSLILTGFRMEPKYDKTEFSQKLKFQDDRFDVTINSIEVDRIGYRRLLEGGPLHISRVVLDGITADIYRDKNVPFNYNKFPPFHNEMLLKANFPFDIDTVSVTGSTIIYNELAAGKTEQGVIRLEDFSLRSYNLTSHPQDDTIKNVMKLNVGAKVMGEGQLTAELILPLEGNTRELTCSGSVGAMHLSPLNAMLEPSINMRFNAGTVTRMTFYFEGDDNVSDGWMEFLYKDIDVVLLKKDEGKEFGFLSFLANTVANSNNPPPGKKDYKSVEIGFERDKNKGMISYIWKTIQSGMVRTILPVKKYEIKSQADVKSAEKKSGQRKK